MNIEDTKMCIYQIQHVESGKRYIGQTISKVKYRWHRHCKPDGGCQKLSRAIQKYGKEAFEFTVLELCGEERLLKDKIASQKYRDRKKLEKC